MVCITVSCKNCGERYIPNGYSYNLKASKYGKLKTCSKCKTITYPNQKDFDWWFCSKGCILEFLNGTKEDYKHDWEETTYQCGAYNRGKEAKIKPDKDLKNNMIKKVK